MADTKDNGGPAFPTKVDTFHAGLSVRDYFAAKAMQALITRGSYDGLQDELCAASYRLADSMLKARG